MDSIVLWTAKNYDSPHHPLYRVDSGMNSGGDGPSKMVRNRLHIKHEDCKEGNTQGIEESFSTNSPAISTNSSYEPPKSELRQKGDIPALLLLLAKVNVCPDQNFTNILAGNNILETGALSSFQAKNVTRLDQAP